MFFLKKAITAFILPPGCFILAILVVSLLMLYHRRRRLAMLNAGIAILLWALSVTPVSNRLIRGLESDFSIPGNPSGDVIIMLGGGVNEKVPDFTGSSAPSSTTMGRIVGAVRLYNRLRIPVIVSGGRVYADADVAVATVSRRFLIELGVPDHDIIVEDQSRDTAENARFTAAICRQRGFSRPILLTVAYHLPRSLLAFDAAHLTVTPIPAYFIGSTEITWSWHLLLPKAGALHTAATAFHEYLGIVYYRLIGP